MTFVHFLDSNDHYLGITLITFAFIYALYITLKTKKPLMPFMFYLLYGMGGILIFREMIDQHKPYVYYSEMTGFLIALYLAYHSYKRSKKIF